MKKTVRRKAARRRLTMPVLFAVALLAFVWGIAAGGNGTPGHGLTDQENSGAQISDLMESVSQSISTSVPVSGKPVSSEDNWALMLVNWEHPLPDDFSIPELTQLRNGHAVDSRAYPELQAMMDDARAAGLQPLICSSYRTWDTQERLFEEEVQNWLSRGYAREEAMDRAAMWVARPGTSEHQTGLAVDIVDMSYQILDEQQENTPVQIWLMTHCAEYGFILRYPAEKSALTGINYEPWHYRYVGMESAREIMARGLCLEEYL